MRRGNEPPLALICSVELEAEPVRRRMVDMHPARVGRKPAWRGRLGGRAAVLVAGGMGKTNAAQALTALLEAGEVAGVVGFGVAGAYAGARLATGALALATAEIYGDEGVAAPRGWLGTDGIGIPLLERDGAPTFNRFELDGARVRAACATLERDGLSPASGPFVTVSCCSGTLERGRALEERFGALCETMEGAAYAHVAALYGVPFLEARGVSNQVEDRDLSRWRLGDAAETAARAVAQLAERWPSLGT